MYYAILLLCYIIFTKNVFLLLDINTKNVILIISLKNIDNYDSLNEINRKIIFNRIDKYY